MISISGSTRWPPTVALIAILAIAVFLRGYRLDTLPPGLYHDEAINGTDCLRNLETHRLAVFYPDNGGREGLFINAQTLSVLCLGNSALALRLPAAICGVLTVFGLYLLAEALFSRTVGLLACFLLATSFWHVVFSRLGLRAIAAPLFLTFGVWLLLVGLRRARSGASYLHQMLLGGVLYGLGFHTYIAYRATPLLLVAILIDSLTGRRRDSYLAALTFCVAAVLATLPLLAYFRHEPARFFDRMSQVSVSQAQHPAREIVLNAWRTGRMFFTRGDSNWRHNFAYRAELFWPVAVLFALGAAVAVATRQRPHRLLLCWLIMAAAPAVLSTEALPHALRSILLIPPVFVLAALGAQRLWGFLSPRLPASSLAVAPVLLAGVLLWTVYDTYFHVWARRPEVARAMETDAVVVAKQINALPREMGKYVAFSGAAELDDQLPAEAAVIQYLTRSSTDVQRRETNIHYLTPRDLRPTAANPCNSEVPPAGATVFCVAYQKGI